MIEAQNFTLSRIPKQDKILKKFLQKQISKQFVKLEGGTYEYYNCKKYFEKVKQFKAQKISLQRNYLPRIMQDFLHITFPNLIHIDLSQNNLMSVQSLTHLRAPHLSQLKLSQNYLTSLKTLRKLSSTLKSLNIEGNNIIDFQYIQEIRFCKTVKSLVIERFKEGPTNSQILNRIVKMQGLFLESISKKIFIENLNRESTKQLSAPNFLEDLRNRMDLNYKLLKSALDLFITEPKAIFRLLSPQNKKVFIINQKIYNKFAMQGDSTTTELEDFDDFQVLQKDVIRKITSTSVSENKKLMILTTNKGFILSNLASFTYTRFQDKLSPFYISKDMSQILQSDEETCGCALGSIIQIRTEVAVIPNFNSDKFRKTCIYIYDYCLGMILSKFDFNLPINAFSLTNRYLIVSNNKRIVLYDYLKSKPEQSEQYYLKTYKSNENTDFIRYFDLFCHLSHSENYSLCECGKYVYSKKQKYLKMFYMRIGYSQTSKSRILYLYDEKSDKSKYFYQQKPFSDSFSFSISEDGKYLTIGEDYGRKINVYNLQQNCLFSVLYLGRQPKNIVNLNTITLPNGVEWVIASRVNEGEEATMHFFKLAKTSPTDTVTSRFKRKFKMFSKTIKNNDILANNQNFINPEFFLIGSKVYLLSVLGEYCEIIELTRSGLHDNGTINEYKSLTKQDEFISS